jgi:hypothetical protein
MGFGVPPVDDKVDDRALRVALRVWMQQQQWAARFLFDSAHQVRPRDERDAAVRLVADHLPVDVPGRCHAGRYGGDVEFVGVADVLGRVVVMLSGERRDAGPSARVQVALPTVGGYEGGDVTAGARGALRHMTVESALRESLRRGSGLSAAVCVNANHWHPLLPLDIEGRVVHVPTTPWLDGWMSGVARLAAQAYVTRVHLEGRGAS